MPISSWVTVLVVYVVVSAVLVLTINAPIVYLVVGLVAMLVVMGLITVARRQRQVR